MRALLAGAACGLMFVVGARADDDVPPVTSLPSAVFCAPAPDLSGAIAMRVGHDAKADISIAAARCMKDDSGAGLYQVFALPALEKPSVMTVASAPVGTGILFPRITVLDAAGKTTRQVAPDAVMFRDGNLAAVLRLHAGDAFLVVESDPAHIGQSLSRVEERTHVTPIGIVTATGFGYTAIHTGSDETNTLTFSLNGTVSVSVEPVESN